MTKVPAITGDYWACIDDMTPYDKGTGPRFGGRVRSKRSFAVLLASGLLSLVATGAPRRLPAELQLPKVIRLQQKIALKETAKSPQTIFYRHALQEHRVATLGPQDGCHKLVRHESVHSLQPESFFEYAEIDGIPGAYLVFTHFQMAMNEAFFRIAEFNRGVPLWDLTGHHDNRFFWWSAYTLKAQTILDFQSRINQTPRFEANRYEQAIFKAFSEDPKIKGLKNLHFIVLAVQNSSIGAESSHRAILRSYLLLSKFQLDPIYRNTVENFWEKELTDLERERIRGLLCHDKYQIEYEPAVIEQFQYQVLSNQGDLENHKYVVWFGDRLRTALTKSGTPVPEVD